MFTLPLIERRFVALEEIATEADTLTFSFSSAAPVKRMWGTEILSHAPGAMDTSRIERGACPFLWHHDPDKPLGIVEKVWVQDNRGYAQIRWSNRDEVKQYRRDVDEKVLTNISCGYRILQVRETNNEVLVTKWEILELSLCSVPEDATVGIGRSMSAYSLGGNESGPSTTMEPETPTTSTALSTSQDSTQNAIKLERERIATIRALAKEHGHAELADTLIDKGTSIDEARKAYLEKIVQRTQQTPVAQPVDPLGLSPKEEKQYSIVRAVQAFLYKDWSIAKFEKECSDEIAKRAGKAPGGFFVPVRDLQVDLRASRSLRNTMQQRAPYAVGTPNAAGVLVGTTLDSASFIDILRNRPLVMQLGARMLSGLVGNLDIPRRTGVATTYWVAEGVGPAESNGTFDLVSFRPKTLGVLSSMTRLMMLQGTPDIEQLVRDDLAQVISLEIDRVCIDGSGAAGQPRGILNTPGIGSVPIGANGGPITYDAVIDLETEVSMDNADIGALNYITNAKVIGALKKLKSTTNEYLWIGTDSPLTAGTPGSLNGYPVGRTNQVPRNKSKGTGTNLSCLIFGNFNDLMVGEWGILDVLPNPYGAGYSAGNVEIRALQTLDIQVRHPESFAAITDIVA